MLLNFRSASRGKGIGNELLSILAAEIRVYNVNITTKQSKGKHSKRRESRRASPALHYTGARMNSPEERNEADDINSLVQMCQCCYTEQDIVEITYCPSNHPFCTSCLNSYAAIELSQFSCQLRCIAASSDSNSPPCNLLLPESTLKTSLSQNLHSLYEKVVQLKQVEEANLKGLEACPFCDFKMTFDETYTDIRFKCMNTDECGIVSCRGCKKKSHWPLDCSDVNENIQHAVEEAMSNALKRTCPKCATSFVKDAGCNKMKCTRCSTIVCYVCRQDISTVRYDHFEQSGDPSTIGRCPMYDKNGDLNAFHEDEVNRAEASVYTRLHSAKILESTMPAAIVGPSSSGWFDDDDDDDDAATRLERTEEWVQAVNRIAKGAEGGFEIVGAGLIFEDEPEMFLDSKSASLEVADSVSIARKYPAHTAYKKKANCKSQDPHRPSKASPGWTIQIIPFRPGFNDADFPKGSAGAEGNQNRDNPSMYPNRAAADASSSDTAPHYDVYQTGSEYHFGGPHPLYDSDNLIHMRPQSSLSSPMSTKLRVSQRVRH